MTGNTILLRGAQVVTMGELGDLPRADILVKGGRIAAIGAGLAADGAEIIEADGCIALPGIVDAHTCLWQTIVRGWIPDLWTGKYFGELLPLRQRFRAEDNLHAGWIAGAEMLSHGTTTVVDYCHNIAGPGFAESAILGLKESGIRHVFTYSFMNDRPGGFANEEARFADAADMFRRYHDPAGLTTLHFGVESLGAPLLHAQLAFARERRAMSCIHVNGRDEIRSLHAERLLGPDLIAIHGNLITDAELDLMAAARMPLCFTPSADVQGTPADIVRRARLRGVPVVIGCDVPSHVASDTLQQLRFLFHVQGYIDGAVARMKGPVTGRRPPVEPGMPLLRARDLLRMATIEAATVLGMQDSIGTLEPGKRADIVLIRKDAFGGSDGDPCDHVLLQTSARDIFAVLVDGVPKVRTGRLIDFDQARARRVAGDARHAILGTS